MCRLPERIPADNSAWTHFSECASMGAVKSDKISQLTGSTSYLPEAAICLTSSRLGDSFIVLPPRKKDSFDGFLSKESEKENAPDRIKNSVKDEQ